MSCTLKAFVENGVGVKGKSRTRKPLKDSSGDAEGQDPAEPTGPVACMLGMRGIQNLDYNLQPDTCQVMSLG